ncbi:MAG TPA: zinc ribbon domain-containing protein [Anaerolineales bacterium]|nr:zinc ribbon domain-containing protein [Anaerolineales bacterium]
MWSPVELPVFRLTAHKTRLIARWIERAASRSEKAMEIPRHWRLKDQRYRLEGSCCPTCGQLIFPPRPVCAQCHCTARPARIAGYELWVIHPSNRKVGRVPSERIIR